MHHVPAKHADHQISDRSADLSICIVIVHGRYDFVVKRENGIGIYVILALSTSSLRKQTMLPAKLIC